MKKIKFIVVQGRTLPQTNNMMQCFPEQWQDEFPLIKKIGFEGIEWIYDDISEKNNPILSHEGRSIIKKLSNKFEVDLDNIVFDWFIPNSLITEKNNISEVHKDKFLKLVELSSKVGFKRIILPMLENNEIISDEKTKEFIKFLREIVYVLDENNIELNLETSLEPKKEFKILREINHEKLKICFDMGNSASYGFEPEKSIEDISEYLGSVHIKDRMQNGPSVPLGEGDVKFQKVFSKLKQINFQGPFSFQVFRNEDSNNPEVLRHSLMFINQIISNLEHE